MIFIHFCKWRFWDICIQKGACSLHSRLSLFWYPAISQFCDSIIRIAYHTAIYKCYTIIHGCGGDGYSHPVTRMPRGKKRQPRRKNGRQERLRNQVNRKSGTCEFRRSSRMVTCQRGFWDIWNTDNKKRDQVYGRSHIPTACHTAVPIIIYGIRASRHILIPIEGRIVIVVSPCPVIWLYAYPVVYRLSHPGLSRVGFGYSG